MSEFQECYVDVGRYLCPKHWEERYGPHPSGVTFRAVCAVCSEIEQDREAKRKREADGDDTE